MGRLACIWPAMGLGVYQKNALDLKTWLLATRWWEYTAGKAEWKRCAAILSFGYSIGPGVFFPPVDDPDGRSKLFAVHHFEKSAFFQNNITRVTNSYIVSHNSANSATAFHHTSLHSNFRIIDRAESRRSKSQPSENYQISLSANDNTHNPLVKFMGAAAAILTEHGALNPAMSGQTLGATRNGAKCP
jgi:hypothetical protein